MIITSSHFSPGAILGVWGRCGGATLAITEGMVRLSGTTGSGRNTQLVAGPFTPEEQSLIRTQAARCEAARMQDQSPMAGWCSRPEGDESAVEIHYAMTRQVVALLHRGAVLTVSGPVGGGSFFTETFPDKARLIVGAVAAEKVLADEADAARSSFGSLSPASMEPVRPEDVLADQARWRNFPRLVAAARTAVDLGNFALKLRYSF